MVPSRIALQCFGGLFAQAIVEYAAKSGAGAASGAGTDLYLGACPVDRTLIPV